MDTNKDGDLSKEELLNGVEKFFIGKTAATVPGMQYYDVVSLMFVFTIVNRLVEVAS